MGMGFSDKDISIHTGDSNGGAMAWLPAMLNSLGGSSTNNGVLWGLGGLLLGRALPLFNNGVGGVDGGAGLGLYNASGIDNIKTAVGNGTTATIANADKNANHTDANIAQGFASQTANFTSQFSAQNTAAASNAARIDSLFQAQNSAIGVGFSKQQDSFADLKLSDCKNQSELLGAIGIAANSINGNINTTGQALTAQNTQLYGAIKDMACAIDKQFVVTNCNIDNTRNLVLGRIDKLESDAVIAARDARIKELEEANRCREHREYINNINVNNNSVQTQIGVLTSTITRLLNGGGNGGGNGGNNGNGNGGNS